MKKSRKTGQLLYRAYVGIGILSVGMMVSCVIAAVIMRYLFSISFSFLEEFITVLFTFSTFWGIGICVIENEHVVIDVLYMRFPDPLKRIMSVVNYLLMLAMSAVFLYYSVLWVQSVGMKLSVGLKIPMTYVYMIQPVGIALSMICIIVKLVQLKQRRGDACADPLEEGGK